MPELIELAELSGLRESKRGKTQQKINILWSRPILSQADSFKTYHSVADVLKKVEKMSSENNTLSIFEHPYRT